MGENCCFRCQPSAYPLRDRDLSTRATLDKWTCECEDERVGQLSAPRGRDDPRKTISTRMISFAMHVLALLRLNVVTETMSGSVTAVQIFCKLEPIT